MSSKEIVIKGAREHNLQDVSLKIPRNKFTVFTGVSGSGKSSLAFDTLYAEGHRRFVQSLSSYARMFLGQLDKPDVDLIEGLSPAVAIDQKTASKNPRSTVGTVTEIYDYLRLLFARVGVPHCPICGEVIKQQSVDEIVSEICELEEGTRFAVLAPVVIGKKGMHEKVFADASKSGFSRVRVDGCIYDLTDKIELDKNKKHDIDVVADRLIMRKDDIRSRLTDSIETASGLSGGTVRILVFNPDGSEKEYMYSQNYACKTHGISLGELAPRMFSFNSPFGACPDCDGLGESTVIDADLVIPDRSRSLFQGACAVNGFKTIEPGSYYGDMFKALGNKYGFTIYMPINEYNETALKVLLYGNLDMKTDYTVPRFEGIIGAVKRRYDTQTDFEQREYYETFMRHIPCPTCKGKRLKKESLAVTVGGKNISEICDMPIEELCRFFADLKLSAKDEKIAKEIKKEINARLGFLKSVGLDYLTLARRSSTLSGGEAQRIRLSTQIGSALVGVLYILDEPSIGLHQRDNMKLINTLKTLRDTGNTLIVVEHDEETMENADYIVDIGPGAGVHGGKVVFTGTPEELKAFDGSITGDYLSGRKRVQTPKVRRTGNGKMLTVRGARENNLKNITVNFPLGEFICVTGVSGSGKSSLVNSVLLNGAARALGRQIPVVGKCDGIDGLEEIDKIIAIDQSPIGRTPRSNPATYTGVFSDIRALFASTPDAKARGYKDGRFSFNVSGGRCEACKGDGTIAVEMHFLPDVYVTCDVCKGKRYNRETLEVKYKGKNIYDVLEMTVDEAAEFFANYRRIARKLKTLSQVGLGYIKLGQSATTLSGGEAQRVKLAAELSKVATGKTVYVLDEPTTGLHTADVDKLCEVLARLVDGGNTVVVIEHNLDLIKCADHIIDLGPEGGDKGGYIIATGTPEEVAKNTKSATGEYLKKILERDKKDK